MNRKTHIIYWSFVFVLLLLIFGKQTENFAYTFYFLMFFIPIAIITSWIFNQVLLPQFLKDRKLPVFLLHTLYLIIVSLDIELIIIFLSFLLISIYDYPNLSVIIDHYKWLPVIMYFLVLLSAFIALLSEFSKTQYVKTQSEEPGSIQIRADRKTRNILLEEICYVESMSDYIILVLSSGEKVITRLTITRIHTMLPDNFIRIHRSYLINKSYVNSFSKEEVIVGEKTLPVSRTYKKEALNLISV